jgi:hypothetical protein
MDDFIEDEYDHEYMYVEDSFDIAVCLACLHSHVVYFMRHASMQSPVYYAFANF